MGMRETINLRERGLQDLAGKAPEAKRTASGATPDRSTAQPGRECLETRRWIKWYVRALRPESSLRTLSRADRATFIDYLCLARWQAPYRGCLCDEDGRPWTRHERAALVGESYATVKRAEEAMLEVGLITFQSRGVAHKDSVGRLHITNYDKYQPSKSAFNSEGQNPERPCGAPADGIPVSEKVAFESEGQPSESEATAFRIGGQPSESEATAFNSEGQILNQPSNLKARLSDEVAFNSEGQNPERPCGAPADGIPVSEKVAFESEGQVPLDVNDVENDSDSPSPSPSPQPNDEEEGIGISPERQQLRARFDAALADVGGREREGQQMDALFEQCCEIAGKYAEAVVAVAAGNTAQWAFEKTRQGKRPRWVQVTAYLVKVCRSLSDEEAERTAALDDDDRLYTLLVGPKPRGQFPQEYEWECERAEFRQDRERFLYHKCHDGQWPSVRKRAEALGLWDDGLVERVMQALQAEWAAQDELYAQQRQNSVKEVERPSSVA